MFNFDRKSSSNYWALFDDLATSMIYLRASRSSSVEKFPGKICESIYLRLQNSRGESLFNPSVTSDWLQSGERLILDSILFSMIFYSVPILFSILLKFL